MFPLSITVLTLLTALWVERLTGATTPESAVMFAFLSALTALALIEHWMMLLPLADTKLWRWMMPDKPNGGDRQMTKEERYPMDFDALFQSRLDQLKQDGNYRYFAELERTCGKFPKAANHTTAGVRDVTVWCSNDYLGMGQHPKVIAAMTAAVKRCGAGAGEPAIYRVPTRSSAAGTGIGRSTRQRRRTAVYLGLCVKLDNPVHPWREDSRRGDFVGRGQSCVNDRRVRHAKCDKVIWRHNDVEDLTVT